MNKAADHAVVDVGTLIDEGRWTGYQKLVMALVASTIVLDGFDYQVLGLGFGFLPGPCARAAIARESRAHICELLFRRLLLLAQRGDLARERLPLRLRRLRLRAERGDVTACEPCGQHGAHALIRSYVSRAARSRW